MKWASKRKNVYRPNFFIPGIIYRMKEKVNRKRKEKHNCEGTEQLWKNYEKKLDTYIRNYQRTEHYGGNQAGQKESSAQTAGYESEAQDAGSQGGDAINGEEQLYCIVNEAGDGMLNVSDMEGNSYTFQTDAAGLQVNDKIFVYYTGNLDDGTAQVLRVEKYVSEE